MTRRGLICNLDSKNEQPETRTFTFDPIDLVLADRGKYLAAALTIARAYCVSGEVVECKPAGNFSDSGWSRVAREPLIWLELDDPWKSTEQARDEDPDRAAARALIEFWKDCCGLNQGLRVNDIIKIAQETKDAPTIGVGKQDKELVNPEFHQLLLEQAGDARSRAIDAKKLGAWLKRIKGQVHNGHRIIARQVSKGHGNRWALEVETASTEASSA